MLEKSTFFSHDSSLGNRKLLMRCVITNWDQLTRPTPTHNCQWWDEAIGFEIGARWWAGAYFFVPLHLCVWITGLYVPSTVLFYPLCCCFRKVQLKCFCSQSSVFCYSNFTCRLESEGFLQFVVRLFWCRSSLLIRRWRWIITGKRSFCVLFSLPNWIFFQANFTWDLKLFKMKQLTG